MENNAKSNKSVCIFVTFPTVCSAAPNRLELQLATSNKPSRQSFTSHVLKSICMTVFFLSEKLISNVK